MEPNYTLADAKAYASLLIEANAELRCQGSVEDKVAIVFGELQNMFGDATSVKISQKSLKSSIKTLCKLVAQQGSHNTNKPTKSSSSKSKK